jgi:CheY-like chemotaxis protein
MEAGKMRLRSAPFDLRSSLRTVLGNFSVQAQIKNLRLDSVVSQDVPPILVGDDARIRQVLFNLVGNAVKFTPEGEVEVSAKALRFAPSSEQINVLITIRDTGIGIPEEQVGRIFENFTQMDGSMTRHYGGAGLGLGIVRRIVKMMDGKIAVESEVGKGTSIHLSLPLLREQKDCEAGEELCKLVKETPLRILLAEDDRVSGLAMKRFLRKLGHTPLSASNGREALEMLREQRFDAVLMDIQMPLLNGLELTRLIREGRAGKNQQTHIIALTAHAMQGDREVFLDAGMDDYLAKPVDMDSLCYALLKAMPRQ